MGTTATDMLQNWFANFPVFSIILFVPNLNTIILGRQMGDANVKHILH